jgi:hypothetical protein
MESQIVNQAIEREERQELTQLEALIRTHLLDYVWDFRMTVEDGGLCLSGRARTYYGKQLAQHGVMKRCRLPIRANNIVVL